MKKDPIPIQNLFYMLCYAWNVLSIKDAIRIFQLDVDNEIYGYCGQAEQWNDLEGGANQMNTVFSLNTMIKCGIITNVKRNVPIRSK